MIPGKFICLINVALSKTKDPLGILPIKSTKRFEKYGQTLFSMKSSSRVAEYSDTDMKLDDSEILPDFLDLVSHDLF